MGGRRFTWIGPGGQKLSKLYHFLLSRELLKFWTNMVVIVKDRCFADHCPILLESARADFGHSPFHFFNHWLQSEGFNDMVTSV